MELKQKCIEENKPDCKFDDFFIDELLVLPYKSGLKIMSLIGKNTDPLPELDNWSQIVAIAVKGKNPYFYEIEYLKEVGEPAIYLHLMEISCDDYLDYINLNQYLK